MQLSVITVMLYGVTATSNFFSHYDLKVGGLNETELYDLNQMALPYELNSAVELGGVWTATFRMSEFLGANWQITEPPLHLVAPFLSRIKSWGFKITFYNTYAGDIQSFQNSNLDHRSPLLSYTWLLERDHLPPPPPPTSTVEWEVTTGGNY